MEWDEEIARPPFITSPEPLFLFYSSALSIASLSSFLSPLPTRRATLVSFDFSIRFSLYPDYSWRHVRLRCSLRILEGIIPFSVPSSFRCPSRPIASRVFLKPKALAFHKRLHWTESQERRPTQRFTPAPSSLLSPQCSWSSTFSWQPLVLLSECCADLTSNSNLRHVTKFSFRAFDLGI